jgi:bifunctional UDP-N-acetylglucosamine pyrophosphorylase / glucosamine-1-phosphate N-acetyltransferase
LMDEGVTLLQPDSIFIEKGITVGRDTIIHPGVHMWGDTIVGCNCQIEPFVVLRDTVLSNRSRIGAFSRLAGTRINQGESVPAYTNIDFCQNNK